MEDFNSAFFMLLEMGCTVVFPGDGKMVLVSEKGWPLGRWAEKLFPSDAPFPKSKKF